ncbi:hypothetical protein PMAYCL1PPCAC_32080, partial [Pristionchus mayeri]
IVSGKPTCRDHFYYYNGWCTYTNSPAHYDYAGAVNECKSKGAFAPSIHSSEDLNFWSTAAYDLSLSSLHFWLDAQCVIIGQPFVWQDGTPTDYYGPNNELLSCESPNAGFTMEMSGFKVNWITEENAPVLCVYAYDPPASTPKPSVPAPTYYDVTTDYCSCNPSSIYLDIVFVVDTSDGMARDTVGDVTATIQSTLYGLTLGTGPFQSNVAALVFAESVQVVRDFGGFRSTGDISSFSLPYLGGNSDKMADAINKASTMISSNGRDFSRGVIVILTDSFAPQHAPSIYREAKAFKDAGGVLISIDYSNGLGTQGLEENANPGFYIKDASKHSNLVSELLYAFCDANCFCNDDLVPYTVTNDRDREVPRGCFHVSQTSAVYPAAESNCESQKGFVATVHDDDKNFLLSSRKFSTNIQNHLRSNNPSFITYQNSTDPFTYWAKGNPIVGQDCAYAQQQSGFNSPWFSSPCADPEKNSMHYACQSRPCGTDFNCFA